MKKRVFLIFIGLLITVIFYVLIKFNNINDIEKNCLEDDFNKVFKKENSLKLDKVYDLSKILNCKSWDEIIIVGGKKANRAAIFLKEGIALPKIDYVNRLQGELLFYLVKDGKLISPPLSFWESGFLYFNDFNDFDYINLKKEDAIFKCIKLKPIGVKEEMLTFELID